MKYFTYTNIGCAKMCHNMILSLFKVGVNKSDIFVECFDQESLDYFKDIVNVRQTYKLDESLKEYKDWSFDNTSDFCKIVSWKWKLIRKFWLEHKEFVFSDSDIVFKSNVEENLKSYKKDFCIQCDSPGTLYCTGFMYFTDTSTCDDITRICGMNHTDDQLCLNNLMNYKKDMLSKVELLSTSLYPNGHFYYKNPTFDKSHALIIHNNHMLGLPVKIESFKKNGHWYANS